MGTALLPDVRSQGRNNVDFSLYKDTRIFESVKLQFRAESFNLLNHAEFGNPNITVGSASFGVISSQINFARQLQFGLRLGDNPVAVITTTPRPIPILKMLLNEEGTVTSHSTTFDNAKNLASGFLKDVTKRYAGTRLGRQELDGELIEDDPEALFKRDMIERARILEAPEMKRIVVAVDPPASASKSSNACGIICVGLGKDDRFYVLADRSIQGARPAQCAKRIVALYHEKRASRVVAEVNQGGAMVEQVLREVDKNLSFRAVHASKGKAARAEPIAALYEQGRVSHVGVFPELEDEMCAAIGQGTKSPDRLDALVWAIHDLMKKPKAEPRVRML